MIVLRCIEIHLNGCIRKIIVKELRVLLILHFQMQRILVKAKLNIYVWSVKTKAPLIKRYDDASFEKKFIGKYLCWFAHRAPYIPYKTMLERIVNLISSSNNTY
jgi:hypothetical protein